MKERFCTVCGCSSKESSFHPTKNICRKDENARYKHSRDKYEKENKERRRIRMMIKRLSNNSKLEGWGKRKSRNFMYDHNCDKDSSRTDKGLRVTRIDHSKQCRDVVSFVAKSKKRRKSE